VSIRDYRVNFFFRRLTHLITYPPPEHPLMDTITSFRSHVESLDRFNDPNMHIAFHELVLKTSPSIFSPLSNDSVVAIGMYIDSLRRAGRVADALSEAERLITAVAGVDIPQEARRSVSSVLVFRSSHTDAVESSLKAAVTFDVWNISAWKKLRYHLNANEKNELISSVDPDARKKVFEVMFPLTDEIALHQAMASINKLFPDPIAVTQIFHTFVSENRIDECMHFINTFPADSSLLFKSMDALPFLATILYKTGQTDTLFRLASYFMPRYTVGAFFVTGVYYMSIRRFDIARKFFSKYVADFGAEGPSGWIGYGLSFSLSDESGHAINAFRRATVLFPKCVLPWVYMGMEYIRTNELKMAQSYLVTALNLVAGDPVAERLYKPVILNEVGAICIKAQQFELAVENFQICCDSKEFRSTKEISVTLSNLGYAYLRSSEIDRATKAFESALDSHKANVNAMAGLGFCHHSKGNIANAIDMYNSALASGNCNKKLENMINNLVQLAVSEFAVSVKLNLFEDQLVTSM
jgi:tetratricopeptide (TPR) repeat protein